MSKVLSSAPAASAASSPTSARMEPEVVLRRHARQPHASRAARSIAAEIEQLHGRTIRTAQVDADDVPQTDRADRATYKPSVVINVALPYQDLPIMDACLEAGVDYLDTANYEPRDVAKFEYKWQWAYQDRFAKRGPHGAARLAASIPASPTSSAPTSQKHLLRRDPHVDIVDCNAG